MADDFRKTQNIDELNSYLKSWSARVSNLPDDEQSVLRFWRLIRDRCDVYIAFLQDQKKDGN